VSLGARVRRAADRPAYWVEGTRSETALEGAATDGRLAILDEWLPAGSGPPLHTHPEDEVYLVVEGELTVWSLEPELVPEPFDVWPGALLAAGTRHGARSAVFVPGGHAHCYRVGDVPARVLVLSVGAGLEAWTERFGVPALAPGPPPAGFVAPAVSREAVVAFSRARGVRRLAPPAPRGPTPSPALAARVIERLHVGAARTDVLLGGEHTGGRVALLEEWLPDDAAPPLHRHPEDETYVVRSGTFTFWGVDPALAPPPGEPWAPELIAAGRIAGPGDVIHMPGGTAHSWRVESGPASFLVISTPAGLERNVRAAAARAGAALPSGERPAAGSSERLAGPPPPR
jgi:quercetin dioxygenase-like cupin family protein